MRNLKDWVRNQIPNFMREGDHEKFIAFLQAYYDFLEEKGQAHDTLFNFNNLNDVDETLDDFVEDLAKSLAFSIPPRFYQNKKDALKHVKEIHSIKGTPNSYKLLFRFMFDEIVDLYYPEEDILRASGQMWNHRKAVVYQRFAPLNTENVLTLTDNASFIVDNTSLVDSARNLYLAEINPQSIEGTIDGELITTSGRVDSTDWAKMWKSVNRIKITSPGVGYQVRDIIYVEIFDRRIALRVEEVNTVGAIQRFRILFQTYHETEVPDTHIYTLTGGSGSGGEIEISFSVVFPLNNDTSSTRHQPSGRSKIQDGVFYSPYTLAVRSGVDFQRWRDIVLKTIHPAGVGLFAQILIQSTFRAQAGVESRRQDQSQQTIFLFNWYVLDSIYYVLSALGKTKKAFVIRRLHNTDTYNLERTYSFFERTKFLAPPYEQGVAGTANVYREDSLIEFGAPNQMWFDDEMMQPLYGPQDYWLHEMYNISILADVPIEDVVDNFRENKTNVQPGSYILVKPI